MKNDNFKFVGKKKLLEQINNLKEQILTEFNAAKNKLNSKVAATLNALTITNPTKPVNNDSSARAIAEHFHARYQRLQQLENLINQLPNVSDESEAKIIQASAALAGLKISSDNLKKMIPDYLRTLENLEKNLKLLKETSDHINSTNFDRIVQISEKLNTDYQSLKTKTDQGILDLHRQKMDVTENLRSYAFIKQNFELPKIQNYLRDKDNSNNLNFIQHMNAIIQSQIPSGEYKNPLLEDKFLETLKSEMLSRSSIYQTVINYLQEYSDLEKSINPKIETVAKLNSDIKITLDQITKSLEVTNEIDKLVNRKNEIFAAIDSLKLSRSKDRITAFEDFSRQIEGLLEQIKDLTGKEANFFVQHSNFQTQITKVIKELEHKNILLTQQCITLQQRLAVKAVKAEQAVTKEMHKLNIALFDSIKSKPVSKAPIKDLKSRPRSYNANVLLGKDSRLEDLGQAQRKMSADINDSKAKIEEILVANQSVFLDEVPAQLSLPLNTLANRKSHLSQLHNSKIEHEIQKIKEDYQASVVTLMPKNKTSVDEVMAGMFERLLNNFKKVLSATLTEQHATIDQAQYKEFGDKLCGFSNLKKSSSFWTHSELLEEQKKVADTGLKILQMASSIPVLLQGFELLIAWNKDLIKTAADNSILKKPKEETDSLNKLLADIKGKLGTLTLSAQAENKELLDELNELEKSLNSMQ